MLYNGFMLQYTLRYVLKLKYNKIYIGINKITVNRIIKARKKVKFHVFIYFFNSIFYESSLYLIVFRITRLEEKFKC